MLVISAAVVVVVASFAVSVRFIANGTLGPLDALKLMALAAVPMLQYALPFAGGFAATLAYHRMSQDNELTACYAGGISHKRVLMPAAILGVVLGAGLFVMADQAMPRLLRKMQELVTDDATRLLQAAIGRGQAIERGNQLLYADKLVELQPEPGSGAYKHFQLQGVVAVETDGDRGVKREMAAPIALVWLFHDSVSGGAGGGGAGDATSSDGGRFGVARDQVTRVVMRLKDPLAGRGETMIGEADQTEVRFTLPSAFRDDPKYLSWAELAEAKRRPESLNLVGAPKRRLAMLVAQRSVAQQLDTDLRSKGTATLTDATGRAVVIRAAGIESKATSKGQMLLGLAKAAPQGLNGSPAGTIITGTMVEVTVAIDKTRVRTHRAERAWIAPGPAGELPGTTLTLLMENVSTSTPAPATPAASSGAAVASETVGSLTELSLPALRPAIDPLTTLANEPVDKLLDQSQALAGANEPAKTDPSKGDSGKRDPATAARDPLLVAATSLRSSVDDLRNEITSKQHERLAASMACVVMFILGAVMGMRLSSATALVVYLWSFLPAVGALVSIAAGQSLTHDHGVPGLLVLYAGVAGLAVFTFMQYRLVARH